MRWLTLDPSRGRRAVRGRSIQNVVQKEKMTDFDDAGGAVSRTVESGRGEGMFAERGRWRGWAGCKLDRRGASKDRDAGKGCRDLADPARDNGLVAAGSV